MNAEELRLTEAVQSGKIDRKAVPMLPVSVSASLHYITCNYVINMFITLAEHLHVFEMSCFLILPLALSKFFHEAFILREKKLTL